MGDILFLSHRPPWPPTRGDSIRSWAVLNGLAERGRVHVVTFGDPDDAALHDALARVAESHVVMRRPRLPVRAAASALVRGEPLSVAAFTSNVFARAVADRLRASPSTRTYAFSGQMAAYAPDGAILDLVDVDSAKFDAYAAAAPDPLRRALYTREGRTLSRFERRVAKRAASVLLISEAEADLWRERGGGGRVRVMPNGIDTQHFDPALNLPRPPELPDRPVILFTGQMDYAPNVQAVTSFAREIMPRLAGTGALFVIAGRSPTAAVRALAGRDVLITGVVADTREWLAHADVVVAPLTIARGVQNKVLEALAMARATVVSTPALSGLSLTPDRELVLADGPEATAAAVRALLADPDRRRALGEAGRARVASDCGWSSQLSILDDLLAAPAEMAA